MTIKRAMRGKHLGRKHDVFLHRARTRALEDNAAQRTIKTAEAEIDASAGGTGVAAPVFTAPAGTIILGVTLEVVTPFDGDATRTVECLDVTMADAGAAAGTTVAEPVMVVLEAETEIEAEFTNEALATEGVVLVRLVYA